MICSHGLPQCLSSWRCMKSSLKHGKYPTCLSSFLLTTLDGLTAKGMWMFPRWRVDCGTSLLAKRCHLEKSSMTPIQSLLSDLSSGFQGSQCCGPGACTCNPWQSFRYISRPFDDACVESGDQKHILLWIWPQDCFAVINLKDMYFHVSILLQHRPFLWTIISVWSNPLWVTTGQFTEVSAFVLLQEVWIWILNYFNDWLILAYSQDLLCKHRDLVLRYFSHLGL